MLLSQYRTQTGGIQLVARDGTQACAVKTDATLYDLAIDCAAQGMSLRDRIGQLGMGEVVDLEALYEGGRILPPLFHPDPAHTYLTGTGLTHLGSASTRAAMHEKADKAETDSMKMFRWGIEGGKPEGSVPGVQPEWFYKGTGHALIAPGAPLPSPSFALDGGEEPEIAGVYIIGEGGTPFRVGFALANEFSDHVTEKQNYLYLAHSKLRACAVGPELLAGDLPADIQGHSQVIRDGHAIFDAPFVSGEANMSHTIANLEHHHFKYGIFCQPGDVHIHMFGTATLSFATGLSCQHGDVFEIAAPAFGLPLRNALAIEAAAPAARVTVKTL
ncbi:AraD1 family protein [Loktanella sp. M215]|uniref:AraD1 family protein n=1 Tax=Loktanella sp. M215 TaxID=2675431 RepID=UPI001F2CB62A|nr:AraD1 family protein [Loktanella sp. M215]MCF7701227.1 GguC protein [Loktanella sp. M215]